MGWLEVYYHTKTYYYHLLYNAPRLFTALWKNLCFL